ncbi:MAG TPA: hypothetical protein DEW39_01420 [Brevibacterium sp.]|nr:hypothetical protein [Brevibacterium sp.]
MRQTRLAHSWSARYHEFKVWNGEIEILSERLGALRREILDTLPVHVDSVTNSFGAFSFRDAEPLDLESLGPGSYVLQLVDEVGDDLLPKCHRTYGAMRVNLSGRSYELLDELSHIGLLVS